MRRSFQGVLISMGCVASIALINIASRPAEPTRSAEVARLRAHFDSVLHELRARDISTLSSARRAARRVLIHRLETYAAAGRFPHNHVVPGQFVPVFRDEHGTLCAMAYLVASTGRVDIVDDVARTSNLAYLPEIARDARLRAWLDSTGLTVEEAARIQPSYDGGTCLCPAADPPPQRSATTAYFVTSGVALGVNAFVAVRSLAPRDMTARALRRNSYVGVVTGTGQVALGALTLDLDGRDRAAGLANVAIGTTAIATSLWRIAHLPPASVAARSVSVVPFVAPSAAGVVLSARM